MDYMKSNLEKKDSMFREALRNGRQGLAFMIFLGFMNRFFTHQKGFDVDLDKILRPEWY